jgi:hypothetical protein
MYPDVVRKFLVFPSSWLDQAELRGAQVELVLLPGIMTAMWCWRLAL